MNISRKICYQTGIESENDELLIFKDLILFQDNLKLLFTAHQPVGHWFVILSVEWVTRQLYIGDIHQLFYADQVSYSILTSLDRLFI